jgi:hypothetical protein
MFELINDQIAAAKRDVRRTYDGPVAAYRAAERHLDALVEIKGLLANRDLSTLPAIWLEVIEGGDMSPAQVCEVTAWLQDLPLA